MAGDFSGKTILLVDDDREILASMVAAIEELGVTLYAFLFGSPPVVARPERSAATRPATSTPYGT